MIFYNKENTIWSICLNAFRILDIRICVSPIPRVLSILKDLIFRNRVAVCNNILLIDALILSKQIISSFYLQFLWDVCIVVCFLHNVESGSIVIKSQRVIRYKNWWSLNDKRVSDLVIIKCKCWSFSLL